MRPFFADLPGAICGRATKRIARKQYAGFVIRISSASMGTLGGKYPDTATLAAAIAAEWPSSNNCKRFVVLTGGEPLLQVDRPLIDALHDQRFEVAVETNGTVDAPANLDWICVSPKKDRSFARSRRKRTEGGSAPGGRRSPGA